MSDALTPTAPTNPTSDTLADQSTLPNAQTNTIPVDDIPPDEKRSRDVNKAIDDALGAEDEAPKPKPKAAEKPEVKPAEVKPEAAKPVVQAEPVRSVAPKLDTPPARPSAYREPPAGFDDAAKAEWEAVPETVRGAMHRRAQEMERGIEKYRTDSEAFEPVRKYHDLAKESGTDLPTALSRYVALETKLRQNPLEGLQDVVANLNLKKSDGTLVTLRDVAASIMGQSPDQSTSRQESTIQRLSMQLQQVNEQLAGLSTHVEGQRQQAKVSSAESEWSSFQREYPRARELENDIASFLTKYPAPDNMPVKERLADAYAWAVAKSPNGAHTASFSNGAHTADPSLAQTQAALPNPAGQKSISGAPGGTDAKSAPRNLNRSAAIEKAMREAGI